MQQARQGLPGQVPREPELPVQALPMTGLPTMELKAPGPEPSVLPGPVPEQPGGMLPDGLPRERLRGRRTLQRRHPGRRREASSRRGPQWWKRRSERIRPIPAVLSLHLWK